MPENDELVKNEFDAMVTLDEAFDDIITQWDWNDCIECLDDYVDLTKIKEFLAKTLTDEQKYKIYNEVYYPEEKK